jgi:hypothetical protein
MAPTWMRVLARNGLSLSRPVQAAHRGHEQRGRRGQERARNAPAEPAHDGDRRDSRRDAPGDAQAVTQRERALCREQIGDEHVEVERRHEQRGEQPDALVVGGCDVPLELTHRDEGDGDGHDQQHARMREPVAEHCAAPPRAPARVVGRGVLGTDAADSGEHGRARLDHGHEAAPLGAQEARQQDRCDVADAEHDDVGREHAERAALQGGGCGMSCHAKARRLGTAPRFSS